MSSSSRLPATSARGGAENLAILLREPFLAMSEGLMRRLAERGHPEVRYAHGNVFQFLDDAGTRTGVLAERAQVTKQAMAQLVAHLEQHGYVRRVPDPEDRRATLVQSTPKGAEVFAIAREYVGETDRLVRRRLGTRRVDELRRLLEELGDALADGS